MVAGGRCVQVYAAQHNILSTGAETVLNWGMVGDCQTEKLFMAKPNYQFEKRQRELAKKKKKDEKAQRKSAASPMDGQPLPPSGPPAANEAVISD